MADRYWVGGAATWDATAGTKWSLTSGGAGGEAVPTSSDAVFFDANSGANIVTISGTRTCASLNCTGFTGTLTGTSSPILQVSGNFTLSAGMTFNAALATVQLLATSNITTAGKTIAALTLNGSGATFTLLDTLRCTTFTLTTGTLNVGANDVHFSVSFVASGSATRVINMGSGTWYADHVGSGPTITFTGSNITVNKETCQGIEVLGSAGASSTVSFTGNGFSYPWLRVKAAFPGWIVSLLSSGATFDGIEIDPVDDTYYGILRGASGQTYTFGSFTRGVAPLRIESAGVDTSFNFECASGAIDLSGCWLRGVDTGGGAAFNAVDSVDAGLNVGITFRSKVSNGLQAVEYGVN